MSEKNNTITLYPSNWLYNAGVVGFLINIEREFTNENLTGIQPTQLDDGTVLVSKSLFENLNVIERFLDGEEKISIYRKGTFRNYITTEEEKEEFIDYVKQLKNVIQTGNCGVCNVGYYLTQAISSKKFLERNKEFNFAHNTLIGPTINKFPNAFWNNYQGTTICHLCNFIILHHDLAITRLSGLSHIFINAPSFRLMYDLNKLLKELYGKSTNEENKKIREILATTLIEYVRKLQSILGVWTSMNIEIIHRYKIINDKGKLEDRIEYYSLPMEVIKIITDRNISNILSDLAEFKILNIILDGKYSFLTELGYKLLREGSKDFNNRNDKLINSILYQPRNQYNPTSTANKILKLYSLIEDKLKRN